MRWVLIVTLVVAGCSSKPAVPDARALGMGKVAITSIPSEAAVLEDGRRVGRTPLTLERRAMMRLPLEIVKDGYQIFRTRKVVEEGRTVKLRAVLRRELGTLVVRSGLVRGATIVIDGHERARTPSRVMVSADVKHVVEVYKPGFEPYRTQVNLSAGESVEIEAELVPVGRRAGPTGWLTVHSDLPAQVLLNGRPFGNAPVEKVKLPARGYRLTLTNPKLGLSKSVRVRLKPGEVREVQVKLRGGR